MNYLFRALFYDFLRVYHKIKNRKIYLGFKSEISLRSSFEGYNKINHHSYFCGDIGYGSYIGENSVFVGKIGRFCSIGGSVVCLCSTHPTKTFVSTSPCFYSLLKQNGLTFVSRQKFDEYPKYSNTDYPVIVGNDVYIGYGVTIIAPVRIGDGAIIAAKSVVTQDVEPYTVVAGCPAKVIRKRFDDQQIEFLLNFKWWERDKKWLIENNDLFEDIDRFINSDVVSE